ncbi:MAG: signal peptide peptidase SppA, partial [Opitutaceae bacterium]|nr:signal peptide peptidase SppA [Opitutaceae bacterium]
MKNFLSSMLGALAAMMIFAAGVFAFALLLVVVIKTLGEQQPSVESGSYLVLDLSANFTDAPKEVNLGALAGEDTETIQIRAATQAIRAASGDARIKGLFLTGAVQPAGLGSGYAAMRELRETLLDFKATGKPIQAYLTDAMTRDYYLASVADDIALDPYGTLIMPGLASESMFFGEAFARYGIGVQLARAGRFKGAAEPFVRKNLSAENREQLQDLLDDLWGSLTTEMALSRNLDRKALQKTVDTEGMIMAESALNQGLVDRLAYRDEILDELKKATDRAGSALPFKQISLRRYAELRQPESGGRQRVAVLYAEGDIVNGEGDWAQVGGDRFSRELRALRQDNNVKAIVLRVNSPGGSASASETIQREMRLAAKEKPVVVSMGSYAASGGYWISAYAKRIYAEPTTITGSIGVFGLLFDVKQLAANWGVSFDGVKTGQFADALSISRPKTDAEMLIVQRSVDWIYGEFLKKVAEARGLEPSFVQGIAQGRVWSGAEAKQLGLVDEQGGLEEAITFAAKEAGLGADYRVAE